MKQLIKYLGSGKIEKDSRKPLVYLTIIKFSDIINIIIPFFDKYSINGVNILIILIGVKLLN